MNELVPEDLVHKKLSSFFIDNLKLHRMQLAGLHSDMKSIKNRVDAAKNKQERLFDDILYALSMIRINKRLKEKS